MPAAARGAQRPDQRAHVAQHPPSVHEHLVQALHLLLGSGQLGARIPKIALQIGDPELEIRHCGQSLLGVDEQRGERVWISDDVGNGGL